MARWDGMVPQTNPNIDNDIHELEEAIGSHCPCVIRLNRST
jgi:hypothetical protein